MNSKTIKAIRTTPSKTTATDLVVITNNRAVTTSLKIAAFQEFVDTGYLEIAMKNDGHGNYREQARVPPRACFT